MELYTAKEQREFDETIIEGWKNLYNNKKRENETLQEFYSEMLSKWKALYAEQVEKTSALRKEVLELQREIYNMKHRGWNEE